jgi:hypothetical protein
MPSALLGASIVLMRDDVPLDRAQLGLGVAGFFATTAVVSLGSGSLAERVGGRLGIRIAATGSALALAGIGLFADRWAHVLALMVVGGASLALALPSASLALTSAVAGGRRGIMFGAQQSAPPAATLLAGVAVPLIGLTVGWRWSFLLAATCAAAVAVLVPARAGPPRPAGAARARVRLGPLVPVAVAAALGSASGISLGAFLVESSVSAGLSPAAAGVLLAGGSTVCVAARVVAGWRADLRARGHLDLVAGMLAVAALGYLGLATSGSRAALLVAATLVAYSFGYGWSGLLFHAVVELEPDAPGVATALVNAGATAGAAAGPALFGVLATRSFTTAWTAAAAATLLGSLALVLRRLYRSASRR